MKLTSKTAGFGIMAVAGLLLCSAAVADTMRGMPMGGDMGGPGHGMMPMPSLADMDANKDGKISKDEISAFRKAQTALIDTNGDGKLSVDELAAMHLKAMTEAAKAMAQRMVADRDTDGDGMLSAAEMVGPPVPPDMFDRMDTNKDGFVDQAELDAAKQQMMDHGPGRDGWRGGRHGQHQRPGMDGQNGDKQDGGDQNGGDNN